jgi:hypothetical protein
MSDEQSLSSFFQRYARALAAGDLPAIAACYEPPGLVVGDEMVIAVPDGSTVERAFTGAAERYRAQGLVNVAPEITAVAAITARMALVDVTWSYLDEARTPRKQTRFRYLVRDDDRGAPRIRVVIAVVQ